MKKNNTYVAIMAGGTCRRLLPASRVSRPKQFLDILGVGKSLIQLTYERFLNLCPKENILVVTNGIYKDLVKEHLPDLTDNQILCEPSRNNTAPCVAYTAFKLKGLNPNANLVIAPADHIILKEQKFTAELEKALAFASQNDVLITLGIQASRPDTGYGYINYETANVDGIHKVKRFTEKPNIDTARQFLKTGNYVWNAGIFIWNVNAILKAFDKYAPNIAAILAAGEGLYNTAGEQIFIDRAYPTTPKISIDFAIMEEADNVYTIPTEFGWSDLGTWGSLHAESKKDIDGNAINGNQVMLLNSTNNLVRVPKDKLVVLSDLEDYIIVDEEDILLVFPKSKEQEIKAVITKIKAEGKDKYL